MLRGKTIVVTGAARGIGRAIAEVCAREGASVGINYRNSRTEAERLAQDLQEKYDVSTHLLPFDVGDAHAVERSCQALIDRGVQIDGWVNNAAVNLRGLLLSQTEDMIATQLRTNVEAAILCCRFVLPHMMARRSGAIVNVGSIASFHVAAGQAGDRARKSRRAGKRSTSRRSRIPPRSPSPA